MSVAETLSRAVSPSGHFISWKEHIIDAEDVNGGLAIRGGDGIAIGDLDRDGFLDIVTAQEDSNHIRIAYGTGDPKTWVLSTLAEGALAGAVEDVAIGDLNNDGWLDVVAACEDAHLIFFENPAKNVRSSIWNSIIPDGFRGRGSWLRVFAADINGDGKTDLTAANKGASDIVSPGELNENSGATSLITFDGPPLFSSSWNEQVLLQEGVPNNAIPVDIDGDGDLDVVAAKRLVQEIIIIENLGTTASGELSHQNHPVKIRPTEDVPDSWIGLANGFHVDFADINQDGRLDIVLNVVQRTGDSQMRAAGLSWLEQPENLATPWSHHAIGETLPDWIIGIHMADIDGDGDLDAVTGGYSGLNVLAGGYSGASRERDDEGVGKSSTVGRIAWFENPGDQSKLWVRHDVSRRVRGMYDMFVTLDLDADGDLDLIAPRGNSGSYDGLFWLEQVRSEMPQPSLIPARKIESRHLPLPPENWMSEYGKKSTFTAPNKAETEQPE